MEQAPRPAAPAPGLTTEYWDGEVGEETEEDKQRRLRARRTFRRTRFRVGLTVALGHGRERFGEDDRRHHRKVLAELQEWWRLSAGQEGSSRGARD